MLFYIIKRLLLIIPAILGVLLINFCVIQLAPGGPIENVISKIKGETSSVDARLGNETIDFNQSQESMYKGSYGIDAEFIEELKKQFGFDKPAYERFIILIKNYICFDFGKSYFKNESVIDLIKSKMPVSVSLGLWTTLLVYLISIPLGIKKATLNGSKFDFATSTIVIIAYAVPSFLFAMFLIVLFAGGSFWQIFPLRGLVSENFDTLSLLQKIKDYFWHIFLPLFSMVIAGFAKLTMLTKNSFLEEINKQYVITARAKGLKEKAILYKHIFRNAMLIVISGFPTTFIHIFFTSSLLIEVLFSLDGLGLMSFEAAMSRDYPVMFANLFLFTLLGMGLSLIGDICYMFIDKRIDLNKKASV